MDCDALVLLRRSQLFAQFSPADLARLVGGGRAVDFAPGTLLFQAGQPADALLVILSGEIELEAETASPTLARAGEIIGMEAVLTHSGHDATARALGPVTALAIPGARLLDYLEQHFDVAIGMISAMAAQLREQVREITELKMQSTAERLAGYLVSLAGEAEGRAVVRLPCEKRLLAENLGMDPATLSRAFAKLRDRGVVANRSDKVVIDDVSALRDFGACAATA
jgi:CRP/FNR family transcriptional activator FtrB